MPPRQEPSQTSSKCRLLPFILLINRNKAPEKVLKAEPFQSHPPKPHSTTWLPCVTRGRWSALNLRHHFISHIKDDHKTWLDWAKLVLNMADRMYQAVAAMRPVLNYKWMADSNEGFYESFMLRLDIVSKAETWLLPTVNIMWWGDNVLLSLLWVIAATASLLSFWFMSCSVDATWPCPYLVKWSPSLHYHALHQKKCDYLYSK